MFSASNYLSNITSNKIISVILFIVIILIAFSNSLFSEFVWDDTFILQKDLFSDWKNLDDIFLTADTANSGDNVSYYRPITYVTFLFDHQLWKLKPFCYNLENVLLHASVVVIFYLLIAGLFGDNTLAFFSSLLFALHPVVTEPVNFITGGRNTMLCAVFSLLSLMAILNSGTGKRGFAVLSLLLYFMALLSKEQAVILPLFLLILTLLSRSEKLRANRFIILAFFAVTALYFMLRLRVLGSATSEFGVQMSYERLELMLYALFSYFRIMLFPVDLNIEYVVSPVPLLSYKALIAVTGMAVLIYISVRRNSADALRVPAVWLILCFLPISNIIPIPSAPVADRFLYIPLLGMCLAAGYGINCIYLKKRTPALTVFIIFLLVFGSMTHTRNNVWGSKESLWKDVVAKSPQRAVGYYNLGVIYKDKGDLDEAVREYKLVIEKDPAYVMAHNNLGIIYHSKGLIDESIREFSIAIELDPDLAVAYYNLGRVFQSQGRDESAVEQYKLALKFKPDYPEAHNNLGAIYKSKGFGEDAIRHFQASIRIRPGSANAHNNLGSTYIIMGMFDKAIEHFRIAIAIDPGHSAAISNFRFATALKSYSIKKK
jgi:tetratricopeptide (TPR) repeat protein